VEYGWSGSGEYLTAPIVALSSELNGLASSSGDLLAVSAPFANSLSALFCDLEFVAGGACSPAADAFLEVWILRSLDGGVTYEDGSATQAPARRPDKTIDVLQGTSITPRSGAPGLSLPPGTFKVALRNQMGVAIPIGSTLRLAEYGEAGSEDGLAGMSGDTTGTTAYRIADMLERFGVQTYSQSNISANPWLGNTSSDYTTTSVATAINWLTANSGMHMNVREYHVAGADTGGGANQLSWCPTVANLTGAKFSVSLKNGGGTADAATLVNMAALSADGSGWLSWAEGLNTPNDGSVTAANCVATQQAIYTGCATTRTKAHPVAAVGPSYTYNTLPPETSTAIANYLTAQQKSDLLAASSLASVRFFPTLNPNANDSAGRGGNADDVALGHQIYFGKPAIIGEWHPTSANADSPSHATDDSMAAYYTAVAMLTFHRLGFEAWFWKSLFDIGQSGDSPWVRVGLFPNSGSGTPRLQARTIRAFYSLTGDTGASRRTFRPGKLDYTITALAAPPAAATPWMGGHHRLFQNSGGTFFLFVSNEQLAPGTGSTNITVTFARAMARITVYDLTTNALIAETPIQSLTNTTTTTLALAGAVYLFVIVPQGSTVPTESAQGDILLSTFGALYDANGVAFSLVNNPPFTYQVNHGGITDSQGVLQLLYWNHLVYQQTSTTWSYWSGTAWVVASGDPRGTLTESPDGFTVTGTGTTMYASQTPGQTAGVNLDLWTITAGAQAAINGTLAGSTTNVIELYYHLHTVYVEQTAGNAFGTPGWAQWSGSAWADCASPLGTQESLEGTLITTVGPAINASQTTGVAGGTVLDTFAININAKVVRNGTEDPGTSNVTQLLYHDHVVYQRAITGNQFGKPGWFSWSGSAWAPTPSPVVLAEATNGTSATIAGQIIYASPTPGVTPGVSLDAWLITEAGFAARNNVTDVANPNVLQLYYLNHFVYLQASGTNGIGDTPGWWRWDGTAWTAVHTPIVKSMALSGIGQQIVGQGFIVSGTSSNYGTLPALQYRDNAGAYVAVSTVSPVFSDEFTAGTWMTHQTWQSGDLWSFGISKVDSTGDNNGTTWWVNPIATPGAASLFSLGNGALRMGLMVNPGGLGIANTRIGTVIQNEGMPGGCDRVFGYHEFVVSVPAVPGFVWAWDIEDLHHDLADSWTAEIDFSIWTDQSNVQHMEFKDMYASFVAGTDVVIYQTTALDITKPHTIGVEWQSNLIKCYIDGVQVGSNYVPSAVGGEYAGTRSMYTFMYTLDGRDWKGGAPGAFGAGNPTTYATVYSYKVWPSKPNVTEFYQSTTQFSFIHPSMSTAQTMTVGVRDASDGAVTATSSSFQVLATGGVTLTALTLTGRTIVAGALPGTPIGTIDVTASGGTFNGTFDVSDTTRFRIIGNTLYNATTLTAGTYTATITATMLGAAGSPLSVTFSDITATTGGNATINFSAPTGKVLNKSVFGISVNSAPGLTYFGNATFQSTANNNLKPSLLRVHPDWELPRNYGTGNMTPVNTFLNNYRLFSQTDVRVIMGCGGPSGATALDYTASQHAAWVTAFANYLNSQGHGSILDWEVGFEWGSTGTGVPLSTVVSYFNTIADALHAVNSSYRVWGPPQIWENSYDTASFANQVGTRCYGVPYHSYNITANTTGQITDPLDVVYGAKGANAQTAITQRNALAGTPLATAPIGLLEHNLAYSFSGGNYVSVDQCGQYIGAVWAAAHLLGLFKSTSGFEAAALNGLVGNGDFGVIANAQTGTNPALIDAQGYFLGKAGQTLYGPEYTASTTISRMVILAVKPTANTYAIALVNWDQTATATVNLSISGGSPSGPIARWQLGKQAAYVYPGSGSFTDGFGNAWSLNVSGNPVVNGFTDTVSHAQTMLLTGGVVWQQDLGSSWYSFTPSGTMVASPQGLWSGPFTTPSVAAPAPVITSQSSFGSVNVPSETIVILTGSIA